jgi:hypothetical protein
MQLNNLLISTYYTWQLYVLISSLLAAQPAMSCVADHYGVVSFLLLAMTIEAYNLISKVCIYQTLAGPPAALNLRPERWTS